MATISRIGPKAQCHLVPSNPHKLYYLLSIFLVGEGKESIQPVDIGFFLRKKAEFRASSKRLYIAPSGRGKLLIPCPA